MKKINIILFVFVTLMFFITSCGHSGYVEKNGKIYHKWIHGGNWTKEYSLVKEADPSTFVTIENHGLNLCLGKDKSQVFKKSSILDFADPITFEQVEDYFWKDKNYVFYIGGKMGGKDDYVINEATPSTFEVLSDLWSIDDKNVFHRFKKLERVHPEDFIRIDKKWGKSKSNYYFQYFRIDSLDYQSAKILKTRKKEPYRFSYYIKDNKHIFFKNEIVKEVNPKTFKALGLSSGYDDKNMFRWGKNRGPITDEYRKKHIDK